VNKCKPLVDGREDGFSVLVDINLREAAFNRIMAYLEVGGLYSCRMQLTHSA
jgi:hypothetical protein